MNEDLKKKTDEELKEIMRSSIDNSYVPSSIYNKAKQELEWRAQEMRSTEPAQKSGIFFEVGGDMTNHGVIQTGEHATIGINVAGNYSSSGKTKIIQGVSFDRKKGWYEKPWGITLLAVIAGLVVAGIVYLLHWN